MYLPLVQLDKGISVIDFIKLKINIARNFNFQVERFQDMYFAQIEAWNVTQT